MPPIYFKFLLILSFPSQFPVTVPPKSTVTLEAEISIEDPSKENAGHGWWYCAWSARTSPIVLKLSITDVEDRKMVIGQEFTNRRCQLDRVPPKDSVFWVFYDDAKSFERIALTVNQKTAGDPTSGYYVRYPGRGLDLNRKTLRKYVCDAIQNGEDMRRIELDSSVFRMNALIDRNARRVYAFLIEAIHEDFKVFFLLIFVVFFFIHFFFIASSPLESCLWKIMVIKIR